MEHLEPADRANADFWHELCGTQLARQLGITDSSPASLKRLDHWYFEIYPYLDRHIPFDQVQGRQVLEVGLGYGTVSQRLAECGAHYQGLDVALGPVEMVNHRLKNLNCPPTARQGSILKAPFAAESFDDIVAIGCYHHTGDFRRAIEESHRLLRPGGKLTFMVYNAYSYRRWLSQPRGTLRLWLRELFGRIEPWWANALERAAYDVNSAGQASPITQFLSPRQIRQACQEFASLRMSLENANPEGIFRKFRREALLTSPLARWAGLDIYVQAQK